MLRIYLPIAFATLFILWILFRLIVKRDLKKHLNTLYLGLFFGVVWAVIYFFIFTPVPVEGAEKVDRTKELKKQIEQILADKKAVVGISISGENGNDTLSINGNMHCHNQSAYKMCNYTYLNGRTYAPVVLSAIVCQILFLPLANTARRRLPLD